MCDWDAWANSNPQQMHKPHVWQLCRTDTFMAIHKLDSSQGQQKHELWGVLFIFASWHMCYLEKLCNPFPPMFMNKRSFITHQCPGLNYQHSSLLSQEILEKTTFCRSIFIFAGPVHFGANSTWMMLKCILLPPLLLPVIITYCNTVLLPVIM